MAKTPRQSTAADVQNQTINPVMVMTFNETDQQIAPFAQRIDKFILQNKWLERMQIVAFHTQKASSMISAIKALPAGGVSVYKKGKKLFDLPVKSTDQEIAVAFNKYRKDMF